MFIKIRDGGGPERLITWEERANNQRWGQGLIKVKAKLWSCLNYCCLLPPCSAALWLCLTPLCSLSWLGEGRCQDSLVSCVEPSGGLTCPIQRPMMPGVSCIASLLHSFTPAQGCPRLLPACSKHAAQGLPSSVCKYLCFPRFVCRVTGAQPNYLLNLRRHLAWSPCASNLACGMFWWGEYQSRADWL